MPSFCIGAPKIMIICYSVPEILCVSDVIYIFHFGLFFCPFNSLPLSPSPPPPPPPIMSHKIKSLKKWKKHLQIPLFYTWITKIIITWCVVPEIWCVMDGWGEEQADRQMEKVTNRNGFPPKSKTWLNKPSVSKVTLLFL